MSKSGMKNKAGVKKALNKLVFKLNNSPYDAARKFALLAIEMMVTLSRVDTGYLIAGWIATKDKPSKFLPNWDDYKGKKANESEEKRKATERLTTQINGIDNKAKKIYIVNNVKYARIREFEISPPDLTMTRGIQSAVNRIDEIARSFK